MSKIFKNFWIKSFSEAKKPGYSSNPLIDNMTTSIVLDGWDLKTLLIKNETVLEAENMSTIERKWSQAEKLAREALRFR